MPDTTWVKRYIEHARQEKADLQRMVEMARAGDLTSHTDGRDTTAEGIAWGERAIKARDEVIAIYEKQMADGLFDD